MNRFASDGPAPDAPYEYRAFPAMVYRDGDTRIVQDADERAAAHADGWTDSPVTDAEPKPRARKAAK